MNSRHDLSTIDGFSLVSEIEERIYRLFDKNKIDSTSLSFFQLFFKNLKELLVANE